MASKKNKILLPSDYADLLQTIKKRIHESRVQAYRVVNKGMIELYWNIGREIADRQQHEGWGRSVVERLSKDLREEFPGSSGLSSRNLWDMLRLYIEYKDFPNLRQLAAELPWGQNLLILSKVKEITAREYYLRMTVEMGWSRNVLLHQIKTDAYRQRTEDGRQMTVDRKDQTMVGR